MTGQRRLSVLLAAVFFSCVASPSDPVPSSAPPEFRPAGLTPDKPALGHFTPVTVTSKTAARPAAGFADEAGGGVFVDAEGQAFRVHLDGSLGPLESHPGNPVAPDTVASLAPIGPHAAFAATNRGLYTVADGWLVSPGWRDTLFDPLQKTALAGTAVAADGSVWLAHSKGLYRLKGQLAEVRLEEGASWIVTSLAAAPAENGVPAVWAASAKGLHAIVQTAADSVTLVAASLSAEDLGAVTAVAGVSESPTAPGELFVLGGGRLLRLAKDGWHVIDLGLAIDELKGAGRTLWLRSGDKLVRYDADADVWELADGVGDATLRLLAADPAGTVWVSTSSATRAVSKGRVPRLVGLDDGARILDGELVALARPMPVANAGDKVELAYRIDDGDEVPVKNALHCLGGVDADGNPKSVALLGGACTANAACASNLCLESGRCTLLTGTHALKVIARYPGEPDAVRAVTFHYAPSAARPPSWETDLKPLFQTRCAQCHATGRARDLTTYQAWKDNASDIVQQVTAGSMPADGTLLSAEQVASIKHWVQAGMQP